MKVSVIIPTSARAGYLDVALSSLSQQAARHGAELIVVDDGPDAATRAQTKAVAERHGARYLEHERQRGLNAARNTGIANAAGDLIVFLDDDVRTPDDWLDAVVQGAQEHPEADVFGGPIRAVLEGSKLRFCGRESLPFTSLDLGATDRDVAAVWGANLAVRRATIERAGEFNARLPIGGDEEEWLQRVRDDGGRIVYLAGAGLDHRRSGSDARLRALCRAAYARGRMGRRVSVRKGHPPRLQAELRVLAGCGWHTVRRRCVNGIVLGATALGRIRETLDPAPDDRAPDYASGRSGTMAGRRATLASASDAALEAEILLSGRRARLARAARAADASAPQRVLVLGVDRGGPSSLMRAARAELELSRHDVEVVTAQPRERGKFENLNAMLDEHPADGHDWLLLLDDDIALPRHFLDVFLHITERLGYSLAQPAQTRRSHAAWQVTRRRAATIARDTAFVEIGPLTALRADTFAALLPFPELRMGWGLDAHWAALARERGWRAGVVDVIAVEHRSAPAGARYDRNAAEAEAAGFLARRPYLPRAELERTLATHRRLR